MRLLVLLSLVGLVALDGCQDSGRSYQDQIAAEPIPQSVEDRRAACDDVRIQLADQNSRLQVAGSGALSPMFALVAEQQLNQNIAALENRAANLQCEAAFSSSAPASTPQASDDTDAATGKIEDCISACLADTTRTRSQCFDDCNH